MLSRRNVLLQSIGAACAGSRRVFYVSADGDDERSGRSVEASWKTAGRVSEERFLAGDVILFRRGDTFFGGLNIRLAQKASKGGVVIIGVFGDKRQRPVISYYKVVHPDAWVDNGRGIWSVSINNADNFSGNLSALGRQGANIGFLKVSGSLKASKKSRLADLERRWDFYSDEEGRLFVFFPDGDLRECEAVHAAPDGVALISDAGVSYSDLDVIGCGGHGVRLVECSNVVFERCHFHELGGSFLRHSTRYGNGIECWINCRSISVNNCAFGDIYDAAITAQGYPIRNTGDGWDDLNFDNNIAYRCSQAFEVWSRYGALEGEGVCPPGSGFRNVSSQGWSLFGIGGGGFSEYRPNRESVSAFLLYELEAPKADIIVSVAFMNDCGGYLVSNVGRGALPSGYKILASNIYLGDGQKIMSGYPHSADEWSAWSRLTGQALGSTVKVGSRVPKISVDAFLSSIGY